MGLADRDYMKSGVSGRAGGRGGPVGGNMLLKMSMWSVTTWIIVICVAIFVIDQLTPPAYWRDVEVAHSLPHAVEVTNTARYQQIGPDEATKAQIRSQLLSYQTTVADITTGEVVGHVRHQWMPPIQSALYFSTHTGFRRFQFWRFVGFQFLHANLTHLGFNMLGLFFFGPMVERYLGRKRFLAFYLLCGICGALMYLVLNLGGFAVNLMTEGSVQVPGLLQNGTLTPLIGASAGVFGVLMAGAKLAPDARVLLFFIIPMQLRTLAYALTALALLVILFGGANAGGEAGHLGGALAGFYFIRRPHHLHGFFDIIGRADPTSHHYRGGGKKSKLQEKADRVLDKMNKSGFSSLSERDKKILRDASEESDRR